MVDFTTSVSEDTSALAEGTSELAEGTGPLAEDAGEMDSSIATLRDDAAQRSSQEPSAEQDPSARELAEDLADQARTAAEALPEAYGTLEQGAEDIHRLDSGAQQVSSGADRLAEAGGEAAAGAQTLSDGINRYTDGVSSARSGADQLADGSGELVSGADQLAEGLVSAESGAEELSEGSGELATGADQLADGARSADDGAGELAEGAEELDEGAEELDDGAAELRDGLEDSEEDIPSYTDSERENLAATASDPVQMTFDRDNELERFGEGLAPLFLAISLWVGGMAIFLLMPPFSREAAARGAGPVRLLLGGLLPALAVGLAQSAIAIAVLHWAIGVQMIDLPLMFGLSAVTSLVFVGLNHGFGALFGPIGKFVALVLVALQISGAGGTYPVPTLPKFFQVIHPFLPMTHAVDAFRGAIGGGWVDPTGDLLWLSAWMVLAVVLGWAGAIVTRRRVQREEGLQESEADSGPGSDQRQDEALA